MTKQFTDKQIVEIISSYISPHPEYRLTPSQIYKKYGMSRQTLNVCARKLGVEPVRKNVVRHDWEWIKANLQPKTPVED